MPLSGSPMRVAGPRLFGLVACLAVYVALGMQGQVSQLFAKPLPDFLMEDYGYYAAAFARWQAGLSPYADHTIGTAFLYPPQSLLWVGFFELLGPLPLKFAVYATLSLLALLSAVIWVLRACEISPSDSRAWIALVLALGFGPVGWCLYLGQVNLFVACTVAAGFFLAERRPDVAGAAIAAGVALKLTPIVLLVLLLQRRFWRVHLAFLVTSLALFVLTGLVFGFAHYGAYLGVLRDLKDSFPVGLNASLSIANSVYLLAHAAGFGIEGWLSTLQFFYTASMGGALVLGAWLTRDGEQRHLFYALVALGMTVLPNVLWYHHLGFALPALLTLWLSPQSTPLLRAGSLSALAVIQLDRVLSPKLDKLTTTPACLLLLVLVLVVIARRSPGFLPNFGPRDLSPVRERASR